MIINQTAAGGGSDAAPFSDEIYGYFSSVKGRVVQIQTVFDGNGETPSCNPALALPCGYWAARAALPNNLKDILGPYYSSDAIVIDGTLSAASFQTQPMFPCTVTVKFPGAVPSSPIHVVVYDRSGMYSRLDCTIGTGTVQYEINEGVEPDPTLTLIVRTRDIDGYRGFTVTYPDGTSQWYGDVGTTSIDVTGYGYGTYSVTADYGHEGDVTGSAVFEAGGPTSITVNVRL